MAYSNKIKGDHKMDSEKNIIIQSWSVRYPMALDMVSICVVLYTLVLISLLAAQNALEVLPVAPPPEPRKLTDAECKRLYDQEENTLRELRVFLRDLLNKLGRDRKFHIFSKPVDEEDVSYRIFCYFLL